MPSIRKRLGREVLLLSLPVLLLGGTALYQWRGGQLLFLPNPFDRGPMRIEFSSFSPASFTPLEVAGGYDWGVQTKVRTVGTLNIPSNWHMDAVVFTPPSTYLFYRKGKIWKQVSGASAGADTPFGNGIIKASLSNVPRDADEVRIRGYFQDGRLYRGRIPPGWTSPVSVRHAGLNHFFTIKSKPFDILVKRKGEAWPSPQVSHQQKFDCVGGAWLHDWLGEQVLVRFRAKPDSGLSGDFPCQVSDVHFFDALGKELKVFQDSKSTTGFMVQGPMRQWVSPDLPENEEVVRLMQPDARPRGGWGNVKRPIIVTGIVSDGECWPTPFKVQLIPREGEVKDYGALPTISSN